MDLRISHRCVKDKLDTLDFDALWPGFSSYPFALYDDEWVVLDDETFQKTDAFIANTAIRYRGRMIAIWKLTDALDLDILASKLAHEMFHAYQAEAGDNRFPDEMDALFHYEYAPAYLTIKQQETALLAELSETYTQEQFEEFLSLRKCRMTEYPYQYRYDCGIEAIEGSAQYVEWQALKALNPGLYQKARLECAARLRDMRRLIPIRALCYDTGAALLAICDSQGLPVNLLVGADAGSLLPESALQNVRCAKKPATDHAIQDFFSDTIRTFRQKIKTIMESGSPIANGSYTLLGVNVFSARYLDGYIYTEYFVMYEDKAPVTLYGNYLLKMESGRIAAIYADSSVNLA